MESQATRRRKNAVGALMVLVAVFALVSALVESNGWAAFAALQAIAVAVALAGLPVLVGLWLRACWDGAGVTSSTTSLDLSMGPERTVRQRPQVLDAVWKSSARLLTVMVRVNAGRAEQDLIDHADAIQARLRAQTVEVKRSERPGTVRIEAHYVDPLAQVHRIDPDGVAPSGWSR
ncbi:MAG: hypothetical protein FWF28_04590 [Micrococcales bacterium]|nr:hypothetical protein [Micrococcales bacterium]